MSMDLSNVLAPLIFSVLCGALMGFWRKLRPEPFVTAVMDLFMPALVFETLLTTRTPAAEMISAGLASAVVIAFLFVLCLLARPMLGRPLRAFALPVLFMNAGFLGIPLMDLAFGADAVGRIVVYDQVQSFFMFSLGIWIALDRPAGGGADPVGILRESFSAFLREPLIHAIWLAVVLRWTGWTVPTPLLRPIQFVGSVTPPLALFALGLRLSAVPIRSLSDPAVLRHLAAILLLRFAGGLACGYLAAGLLSLEGLTRDVVLIGSALPSAVFSYVLAERYNAEPDLAAVAVFSSTILYLPLLPLFLRSIR